MSQQFTVGDRVRLISLPPYVKTADPMPTLRSSAVLVLGEEGVVLNRKPGGFWSVRFANGAYLLDSQFLESVL
ncbi:MAG TPA: DUF3148 domain-containing protein [Thermosynechococcaceae cyanobacterium]